MNQIAIAGIVLLAICLMLGCDESKSQANQDGQKIAREHRSVDSGKNGVLYRGHIPSRTAIDAVPWKSPARDGSNTLSLEGDSGKVDVTFEEGEHLDVTAQTVTFLQWDGELTQMDVALVNMNKDEAADALDRLATNWEMDKSRLVRWKEAGKPDFPTTGFFLEKTRPLHFTTLEIGPSFDPNNPYIVHFNYNWKSQKDLEMFEREQKKGH